MEKNNNHNLLLREEYVIILLINMVIMQLLFLVSYFKCFVVCLFNPCSNDASFFFIFL